LLKTEKDKDYQQLETHSFLSLCEAYYRDGFGVPRFIRDGGGAKASHT
jgi:hypothetical protein